MAKQKPTQTIEVIPAETSEITIFTETVQKSGLELSKAEKYALGYAPLMGEVIAIQEIIKGLDKTNAEHAKIAKRASLDIGKICSRLTDKKASDKSDLLLETKHIDNLFNLATSTARLTQKDADVIAEYADTLEKERLAKLADTRRAELESYGADTSYLPLDIMGDEQYARCLESAQLAFEARKVAAEKLEAERLAEIERVRLAEIEASRLQAERIEAERLEAIRIREELASKERELVKEREANAEKERLRIETENKAIELRDQLRKRFATYAIKDITPFGFTLCENGIENKELGWFIGCRHYDGFDTEVEMKEWVKDIQDRARIMIVQKSDAEKKQLQIDNQNAETERLKKELQAKKDAESKERERLAQVELDKEAQLKAAQLAPDKDKINALYLSLKNLPIPDFTSIECQVICTQVLNKISHILSYIKEESKKLS